MNITVFPSPLSGSVRAIGSKSDIHRLLICAAFADSVTEIRGFFGSEDVYATIRCIKAIGADAVISDDICTVTPVTCRRRGPYLDCGESGSTFRFMLPVACAVCGSAEFTGRGRLPDRPVKDLISALRYGGISFSGEKLPFRTHGKLTAGTYYIPGNISSQYVSGLLIALSLLEGKSELILTSAPESSGYIDMTVSTLSRFGAEISCSGRRYTIPGGGLRTPGTVFADGDWSNAAFFLTAGALGGKIEITGLNMNSIQGDRKILDILKRFGAVIEEDGDIIRVSGNGLHGCSVDLAQIPDMLPSLAAAAAFARGDTVFTGGSRLRLKESDRLSSVCRMIISLGGSAVEHEDGLTVRGVPEGLRGGSVDGSNDHRIVMAAAVAAAFCKGSVTITDAQAVNKSYPTFFKDFNTIGGKTDVI